MNDFDKLLAKVPELPSIGNEATVTITLDGGLVQTVLLNNFPGASFPIAVRIKDYDAEGNDMEDLFKDERGDLCFFWETVPATENGQVY